MSVLNYNLRELVRTHVILAPGACGREGQSAGSGTISSRSGGSADVCPSMVFLKLFQQKIDEIVYFLGKALAKHPYGSKAVCFYGQKEP